MIFTNKMRSKQFCFDFYSNIINNFRKRITSIALLANPSVCNSNLKIKKNAYVIIIKCVSQYAFMSRSLSNKVCGSFLLIFIYQTL